MALTTNGLDTRNVEVNGVKMNRVFINGTLVWLREVFNGAFDRVITSSSGFSGDTATYSLNFGGYMGPIANDTNGESTRCTNELNPSSNVFDWADSFSTLYAIGVNVRDRNGLSTAVDKFEIIFKVAAGTTPYNDDTKIVITHRGVEDVNTTVGTLRSLGFVETAVNTGVDLFGVTGALDTTTAHSTDEHKFTFSSTTGVNAPATIRTWILAIKEASNTTLADILVVDLS